MGRWVSLLSLPPAAGPTLSTPDPSINRLAAMFFRRNYELAIQTSSTDPAHRSVEAVLCTESPSEAIDPRTGESVDRIWLVRGAAFREQVVLMDTLTRFNIGDVVGSVRGLRAESDRITGRLFFSGVARGVAAWELVRGGHVAGLAALKHALAGVQIRRGETHTVAGKRYTAGERTLQIVTRWQLVKIALMPTGGDAEARVLHES